MADFTWVGAASGAFNTAGNWSPAQVPGYGTISVPAGTTISLGNNVSINNLNITGNGLVTFTGANAITFYNAVPLSAGQGIAIGATTALNLNTGLTLSGTGNFTLCGGTITETQDINLATGQNLELTNTNFTTSSIFSGAGSVTLNGSTATFTGQTVGVMVNFAPVANGGVGNVLNLQNYANDLVVQNFSFGDKISVGGAALELVATSQTLNGLTVFNLQGTTGSTVYGTVTLAASNPAATTHAGAAPIALNNTSGTLYGYPCFYPGTMIATAAGEIAVENIVAGTLVKTAAGEILPVRWVGWSQVALRFADALKTLPIRIKAGAVGENVPARDLLLSPDHAIFVQGVLVQAGALVNGTSILRENDVPESFRYYHIELATHELLLAENCPAESFVDNIDRMNFHNWDEREAPRETVPEMDVPRAKSARQVPGAVRAVIGARAKHFSAAA